MSVLLTRRKVVAGMGLLGLGILTGCDSRGELSYKYGKDLSNQILGRTFKLKDTDGDVRMLELSRHDADGIFRIYPMPRDLPHRSGPCSKNQKTNGQGW